MRAWKSGNAPLSKQATASLPANSDSLLEWPLEWDTMAASLTPEQAIEHHNHQMAEPQSVTPHKRSYPVSDRVSDQRKTIAIDSGTGLGGNAPRISEMNPVHLAAQVWASASFPVERFQAYTSPFGYRASPTGGYRSEFHYGLDIAAPKDSYIRNWWSGTVLEVSDGSNCGTSIVIQSGEWIHMYCHMSGHAETRRGTPYLGDRQGGIELAQGQTVVAGDRIGRVGMTGRTTGPHLHWGLKYQGNWVDPAWVLQAMAAGHHALSGQP